MADLPVNRLEPALPFMYCTVDYFSPWIVQGRKAIKRYGVMFTCMASRAIHLETSNTMDTFICRRGLIRQLRSDQGTNFVGAKGELKEALKKLDHDTIRSELLKEACDWFIFKMMCHQPVILDVWERQIRTGRGVMSALLEKNGTQLDNEALRTFFCEVEAIINSHPLTVDNLNDSNCLNPLTPNHLLTM